MSPSEEEEEDNRVAVIKYESERGDGGEREEGASYKFSQVQMEGGNQQARRKGREMAAPAQAPLFRFNKWKSEKRTCSQRPRA